MSVTVNNNLQNLLSRTERAKDDANSTHASNRKPVEKKAVHKVEKQNDKHEAKSESKNNLEKNSHAHKTNNAQTQNSKIENNAKSDKMSEAEIAQAEAELSVFDDVLNDQIENGDLIALAASSEGASVEAKALLNGKNVGKEATAVKTDNWTPEQVAELAKASSTDTAQTLNAKQTAELLGAGTFAVKANQAPVVAGSQQQAAQAQLGEGENVINMMNAKKTLRPQVNPYAKDVPKTMFSNLNKDVKAIKSKADALMVTPEGELLKKADMLGDMNKVVNTLAKSEDGSGKADKANVKVLDLSKIQASNQKELISNISDYIAQNATASKSKVEMSVQHTDLGRINITAMKAAPGQVNIEIQTMSNEGHKFFTANQTDLLSHLSTQGVNVADFKLENSSNSNSSSSGQGQNSGNQFSSNQQQGQNQSEDNNRRDDSRRRDELWNLLKKDVA
ncbi:MAG: hypothetical protein ACOYL6_09150 [Bacteriovoracaceae bacterium]